MKKIRIDEKKLLKLLPLVLIIPALLCWPLLFLKFSYEDTRIASMIEKADELAGKKVYVDALQLYEKVLSQGKNDYSLCMKTARCCLELEEYDRFRDYCSLAVNMEPEREEAYLMLSDFCCKQKKYSEVYEISELAKSNGCISEALDTRLASLDCILSAKYIAADSVGDWHRAGDYYYAVFERFGNFGIIRSDGYVSMKADYTYLGIYSAETYTMPACVDGELCWIDRDGRRRIAPEGWYDYIGSFSDGAAPFRKGEAWGYVSEDGAEKLSGLGFAGAFAEDVAAVCRDGKYGLIGPDFCSITGFKFDGILCDSNGCCSEHSRCVVVTDGKYYLCDLRGRFISEGYDGMKLPASPDGYTAFLCGGLWGFLSPAGDVAIEPAYEDAASFSQGLAPVREGDAWHYIDSNGARIGEEDYEYASSFSPDGCAIVKKNGYVCALYTSRQK